MSHVSLFLVVVLLAVGSISAFFMWSSPAAASGSAASRAPRAAPMRARSITPPSAQRLEPALAFADVPQAADAEMGPEAIRDRYVAIRFAGLFDSASDFSDVRRVIKAARLYYEDGRLERAQEALAIAIQNSPEQVDLRLAQIELAFLARDAELFTELALRMRKGESLPEDWNEICHLGRALAPGQALFDDCAPAPRSHFGNWPDTPNWIQASWDLTPDVLAADLHRAITQRSMS